MKNRGVYIVNNEQKIQAIIQKATNDDFRIIDIDGVNIISWEDYVNSMIDGFNLGMVDDSNWKYISEWCKKDRIENRIGYSEFVKDCLKELEVRLGSLRWADGWVESKYWEVNNGWVNCPGYVLVIRNFSQFLRANDKIKKDTVDGFNDIIIPAWQWRLSRLGKSNMKSPFEIYLID